MPLIQDNFNPMISGLAPLFVSALRICSLCLCYALVYAKCFQREIPHNPQIIHSSPFLKKTTYSCLIDLKAIKVNLHIYFSKTTAYFYLCGFLP